MPCLGGMTQTSQEWQNKNPSICFVLLLGLIAGGLNTYRVIQILQEGKHAGIPA